jgi:hypothetical protein
MSDEKDAMPTTRDLASDEDLARAWRRGTRLGFKGKFLDHFIENEVRIQEKPNRRESAPSIHSQH